MSQIVVVTGKGGVGKSTVTAMLGLRSAAQGQRTLMIETGGARILPKWWNQTSAGYTPVALQDNLSAMSVTPEDAIEDFVVSRIRVRSLYKVVFKNRVMGPLIDGVPGLSDLVQLGKAYALAEERKDGEDVWDRIIIDAPATGHGLTMLRSPAQMMKVTRAGPFFENAQLVHDVFTDPERTQIVVVTLPEEMPVNETIDLWERLGGYRQQVMGLVLNSRRPEPFPSTLDWPAIHQTLLDIDDPGVQEAVQTTDDWVVRYQTEQRFREKLEGALPVSVTDIDRSYAAQLTPDVLSELAQPLDPWVTP